MMLLVVSVPASLALTGMGGAEAAVWGYRAAFALSAALSLAVLIVCLLYTSCGRFARGSR